MITAALAKYLDAQGIGIYHEDGAGSTIFIEHEPPSPDELIALRGTGGNPLPPVGATIGYDEPTVQLIVRGPIDDPRAAYETARALYSALVGLSHVTFDESGTDELRVLLITSTQSEPYHLGADENGRHRYTLNLAAHVRAATTHRS